HRLPRPAPAPGQTQTGRGIGRSHPPLTSADAVAPRCNNRVAGGWAAPRAGKIWATIAPMSGRRTSINDVAKAAGVAIKTVSRVLNNEPNVREETRAQVLAAVKKLNYHPSLSARSLASRRSYLVGLVYDNPSANYTIEVQRGALARCREAKFLLLLHEVAGRTEEVMQDILTFANQTHLDGLIVAPPLSESAELIRA